MKRKLMIPLICRIAVLGLGIGWLGSEFYHTGKENNEEDTGMRVSGSVANMNLDRMIDYADLIISGVVTNITGWEILNDNVFKSCFVTVDITESFKGDKHEGDIVEIEMTSFKGVKDVSVASMPANPEFAVGDEATLFLAPSDHGTYYIVAINQGVFYIDETAEAGDTVYKHKQRVGNDVESFTRSELLAEISGN